MLHKMNTDAIFIWLNEIRNEVVYGIDDKTLATALALFDRLVDNLHPSQYKIYGCVCIFFASVIFSGGIEHEDDIKYVLNDAYSVHEIRRCIIDIIEKTGGRVFIPTAPTVTELSESASFCARVLYLNRWWLRCNPSVVANICTQISRDLKHPGDTNEITAKASLYCAPQNPIVIPGLFVIDGTGDLEVTNISRCVKLVSSGMGMSVVKRGDIFSMVSEMAILSICNHPNIVKTKGVRAEIDIDHVDVYVCLYMELTQSDLAIAINCDGFYRWREWTDSDRDVWRRTYIEGIPRESRIAPHMRRIYASDICEGVKYFHSIGILHKDIKPENILLNGAIAKLCDFGLSSMGVFEDTLVRTPSAYTYPYRAPEVMSTNKVIPQRDHRGCINKHWRGYGLPADIFALGITLIELETGVEVLPSQMQILQQESIMEHSAMLDAVLASKLVCVKDISYRNLLMSMISPEPFNRPTAVEVCDSF